MFRQIRTVVPAAMIVFALFAALGAPQVQAEDPVAKVTALTGTVTALRGGKAVLLVREAAVFRADKIFTYHDARVKLRFADGTVVAVGADSRLIVVEYLDEGSTAQRVLDLVQGILRATVSAVRGEERFDIRTRTAVASARSTDWMVEAKADTSAVFVIEGRVAVESRAAVAGEVVLGPGEGTDVATGQAPKAPVEWGQPRVDGFLARTTVR